MLEERYVSYELAELLDSKGFDGKCRAYYRKHDKILLYKVPAPAEIDGYTCNRKWVKKHSEKNHCDYILAPTLQMAKEWLKLKHNIFVEVSIYSDEDLSILDLPEGTRYTWNLYNNASGNIRPFNGYGKTPLETLEEAIKFCIKTFC